MQPPPPPDPDAAMIARLQGAKGFRPGLWLRENKVLVIVFGVYFAVIGASTAIYVGMGESPGPALLVSIFVAPLVMLRMYVRWRRR